MSTFGDPVLRAWAQARDAQSRTCPDAASVTLAALSGVVALSERDARHLLDERCERCEHWLLQTWERTEPPAKVLARASDWPDTGALRSALNAHLDSCDSEPCRRTAARLAVRTAPEATPARRRLADAVAYAAAELVAVLLPREPGFAAVRGSGGRPDEPPADAPTGRRSFGTSVAIELSPTGGEALIEVDFEELAITEPDAIAAIAGRPVTVYVTLGKDQQVVAATTFVRPEGVHRVPLEADAGALTDATLRIAFVRQGDTA
jgi:hypothetical protein